MSRRLLDGLLAASLLTMTWAKIHWQAGSLDLTIGNITASAFVAAFVIDRLQRRDDALPRPAITLCGFMLTFLRRLPGRLLRPRLERRADILDQGHRRAGRCTSCF